MSKQEFIATLGDTGFALRINDTQKGRFRWDTQRHCNADYELHMLLSGRCTVSVEDRQYTLTVGDAILIAPGLYHQPLTLEDGFQRFSVSFFPFSGKVGDAIRRLDAVSILRLPDTMRELALQILEENVSDAPFRRELTGAMLSQVMVYVLRELSVFDHVSSAKSADAWRTDVIDDFFSEELTYGTERQLAERLHLSRRQLSRVMQTHYGMSFQQKLRSARMDRAGWLLRTTDRTIAQIYGCVGYNSEAAFYQNFKAYYGMTPLKYRKEKGAKMADDEQDV